MRLERRHGLVCVVTSRSRLFPNGTPLQQRAALIEQARAAATAGADLLQVRERDLPDRDLIELVSQLAEAVGGSGVRVLVNDRPDIAIAAGAHGVHLRSDGIGAAVVRRLSANMLIGQSVHDRSEARAAADSLVDFVLFGTVFPSASKPHGHPTAGLEALREVADDLDVPVLAIGGVNLANVDTVAATGAAGVAAIGWFATTSDEEMRSAVQAARQPFDTSSRLI